MKNIINAVILSIIAMGLFAVLCAVLPSVSAFEPVGRAIDEIAVSDIYYSSIRDNRPVGNDKFLIIDTSLSGRREISQAIDHAAEAGATVIGLDIIFSLADTDSAGTRSLQQSVSDSRHITVAAVHLDRWNEALGQYVSTVRTPLDSIADRAGYSNLINHSDNSFIRNYSVAAPDALPSFAQAIAVDYLAAFGESAAFDPTDEGIIDFTPQNFTSVSAGDLRAIDSLATGRIVLFGALHVDEDTHFTPVGAMSGVVIQAYAVDTLLENRTTIPPVWPVRAGSFVIIALTAWGFIVLRRQFEARNHNAGRYTYAMLGIGNLIYPTVAVLIVIFIVGEIYVLCGCYISPLFTVGSLAFIPVAYDLQVIASGLFRRRSATAIALLAATALSSSASEQSSEAIVLPPWFEEAVADPDIYIGVAPPCTNRNAAEDMAIATAVINWLFNSGQYTAKVDGGLRSDILPDSTISTRHYVVGIESKKPVEVVLSDIFMNDRNECFVACKIQEETIGQTIKFTKEIVFDEATDSLYEKSGFKIVATVRKPTGRYNRANFRNIEGYFTHILDQNKNFYSIKTNNIAFDANISLNYPNRSSRHPSAAEFPIEPNLGTSLLQLVTAYPPVLSEMKATTTIYERHSDKGMDDNSEIYLVFSNKGDVRPFNLRIAGLSGKDIYYTVAQQNLVKELAKQYDKADLAEKSRLACSTFRTNDKLGVSARVSMAYIDAISLWAANYDNSFKGRIVTLDSDGNTSSADSGIESTYESLASCGNFKLLWHIGDGMTTLPADIVGKDFDYSCGVSVLNLNSSEERLAALDEAIAKNGHQQAESFIKKSKDTLSGNESRRQVKFKFRTPNNTKFSEQEFKLSFTTNSRKATYHISGESAPRTIPESALSAGVFNIELPRRDCDLTVADEAGQMHVLHFVFDEALSLRKSATLHILSIGVNDYEAQNLKNLKYAEDDARAVVEAIASRHQYTFANINKTVIIGKDVTPERIGAEIEKIADNAGFNDLAIIFFAGHGLVDARNYYLATSKVTDSKVPRKGGFSARSFAEKIGYINCKLVVFIDACYSAKMLEQFRDGSVNNGEFFKELISTPNGTNIYTSSGADVRSRELDEYGHGVFTQALIEACDFKNSDADSDGRITITEIRNYLERRIVQMTGNEQRPVYRNLEEIDYSLFIR